MKSPKTKSTLRIFGFSIFLTVLLMALSLKTLGTASLVPLIALAIIEVTFSFENAIINAKILNKLSDFWQTMFLTIGIFIAIFGMRIVFPILIVSLAANLNWQEVLDLALNDPAGYSEELEKAYPAIAGFGSAFLCMLGLQFFLDPKKKLNWLPAIEKPLSKLANAWMPAIITAGLIGFFAILPTNQHPETTFATGAIGIVTFIIVHGLAEYFGSLQQKAFNKKKAVKISGFAGFLTFMYLELLDASFSLDSVIGAFAISNQVVLIAIGLGIGAVWVRSMTIYLVHKKTLNNYRYLEHGAHYAVLVLALTMFLSGIYHFPEALAGIASIIIISLSVISSNKRKAKTT